MVLMWIYSSHKSSYPSGSTDRFLMSYTLPSPLCSSDPGPLPGLCLQPCLGHLGWGRWWLERHGQCDLQHGTLGILQLLYQQQLYPRWTWMWTHLQRPGVCTGNTVFEQTQLDVSDCHRCDAMVVYGVVNVVVGTIFVEFFCEPVAFLSHPAPCTPANVGYTYSCETGIALLSWDETLGRESFYTHVRSGDHMASCSTSQTDCPLPSLLCGRTYDVEVLAVGDHCNSSVPGVTQIQTGTVQLC